MKNQKEAVYSTVKSVLAENGIEHEDFTKVEMSKELKSQCISILVTGFEQGEIELKSKQENLKSYVNGLLNNWLRKDKRFNGNVKYKAKNPGSRTGQQDPMVKNLRILLSTLPEGTPAYQATKERIETRVAELKAERARAQVKEIDFSAIPADIKALLES